MRREDLVDLNAFATVAEERNFTRAAIKLGTSQSALSYTIRRLEARLGVRLLTRTTRSVAPTEAGERLLRTLGPALDSIGVELALLSEMREKPAGTIRITSSEHPAQVILWPALEKLLALYPDIKVEIVVDYGLTDIVAERYDAGVRLGEQVAKDMIAVRIGPDMRMAVVAAPSYFATRKRPRTPQDLTEHNCINLRLPTAGGIYAWEFEKAGREVKVRADGQFTFNNIALRLNAVLAGFGIAYLPEDQVREHLADGRLIRVLADWCPPFAGYHLYYPGRRHLPPAFALLVDSLRCRGRRERRKIRRGHGSVPVIGNEHITPMAALRRERLKVCISVMSEVAPEFASSASTEYSVAEGSADGSSWRLTAEFDPEETFSSAWRSAARR